MNYCLASQANIWDHVLDDKAFAKAEPEDEILALLDRRNVSLGIRGLDIGCGAGRHLVAAARRGYQMTGIDFSTRAAHLTAEALKREGENATLAMASMDELPFPNSYFDFSLSWCVMNHGTQTVVEDAIRESLRVVRRGGYAVGLIMSPKDSRYGKGVATGTDTLVFTSGLEQGVFHYFAPEERLRRLLEEQGTIEHFEEVIERSNGLRRFHPAATRAAHYWYIARKL